jgi:hypothetical protein
MSDLDFSIDFSSLVDIGSDGPNAADSLDRGSGTGTRA